jgi:acyl dehydratase
VTETIRAEAVRVGDLWRSERRLVSREEILEFGRLWDPLPIHTDESLAREGHFGDVIASGIHSLAILQRLATDTVYYRLPVLAARGLASVRFLRPLFAGTEVWAQLSVIETRPERDDRLALTIDSRLIGDTAQYVEGRVDLLLHRSQLD